MLKNSIFLCLLISILFCSEIYGQTHKAAILKFQEELNAEFSHPTESPLKPKDLKKFKNHTFFPINSQFRIEAKFVKAINTLPFRMKTSTNRRPIYEKYGEAIFQIDGKTYKLNVYQNHELLTVEGYKDYLFLPYTDLTNGKETYGGGRYIGLRIPSGDTIIIDFNKSYHPLCAYNHDYSCPIPPEENDLNVRIEAGVKLIKF